MSKKQAQPYARQTVSPIGARTREESFRYCEKLTADHYENFPVASLLLPRDKRRHLAALYAFARTADDFADEPGLDTPGRLTRLEEWEEHLDACAQGRANHPVFIALSETIETFDLPLVLFRRLLAAFRTDVTVRRYSTYDDVLGYCENSANPVGRLVLAMFGYSHDTLMKFSDAICTALQLTNFWQDLSIDLQRDRVYLPQEDLLRFGYTETDLFARTFTKNFRDLMSFQLERTDDLFQQGRPLLSEVGKDLKIQLRLTWHGGRRIIEKIRQHDHNVYALRPTLGLSDWLAIGGRSIFQ